MQTDDNTFYIQVIGTSMTPLSILSELQCYFHCLYCYVLSCCFLFFLESSYWFIVRKILKRSDLRKVFDIIYRDRNTI